MNGPSELENELAATRAELAAFGAAVAAWPERLMMRAEALRRLLPEDEATLELLRETGTTGPILGVSDEIEALARDHAEGLARRARRMAKELAGLAEGELALSLVASPESPEMSEHQEN